jgi:hypothetical protein
VVQGRFVLRLLVSGRGAKYIGEKTPGGVLLLLFRLVHDASLHERGEPSEESFQGAVLPLGCAARSEVSVGRRRSGRVGSFAPGLRVYQRMNTRRLPTGRRRFQWEARARCLEGAEPHA